MFSWDAAQQQQQPCQAAQGAGVLRVAWPATPVLAFLFGDIYFPTLSVLASEVARYIRIHMTKVGRGELVRK